VRSAGINDLRKGNIVNVPTRELDAHEFTPVPLPERTRCHAVAASLAPAGANLRSSTVTDGLVPVASALGRHDDAGRRLDFEPDRQAVVFEAGHLDLLSHPEVFGRLRQWLG
jgi:hypothetical protein